MVSTGNYRFGEFFFQARTIFILSWNLVPRPILISKYRWWYSVSPFLTGNTLLGQLWSKKIKIVSLNWNLVPRLIPISKIWWRIQCSLFLCQTKNTLFRQIRSKKWQLSAQAEIWYLDYFEYAEFNGLVFFFCFRSEIHLLGKFDAKIQNS